MPRCGFTITEYALDRLWAVLTSEHRTIKPPDGPDLFAWAADQCAPPRCVAELRRGELMALRIEDVDLGAGVIHVRRGWDVMEGEILTKSGRAQRVPVPVVLRDHLDEHMLKLGWKSGLVVGVGAVSPFSPTPIRERSAAAWRKAKLTPIGLHECRHTFASLMIAAGVNAKALTTYMGYSDVRVTFNLYGHLMPGNESEAAARLDAYLSRASEDAARASLAPVAP